MKGMATCLETLSLYRATLTFPLRKNTYKNVFYKTGNSTAVKSLLRFFRGNVSWRVFRITPMRGKLEHFEFNYKCQFCSNVWYAFPGISVSRKNKVNLDLRPRSGNAKNFFGPTNPPLVEDVITRKSSIKPAFVL